MCEIVRSHGEVTTVISQNGPPLLILAHGWIDREKPPDDLEAS